MPSAMLTSNGKFLTINRLPRLGAGTLAFAAPELELSAFVAPAPAPFVSVSIRFLSVTERRAPLKTCAWSFSTARVASAGVLNVACAEDGVKCEIRLK
jgi:hypothetical protein